MDSSLEKFTPRLQSQYSAQMRAKFGLFTKQPEDGAFFSESFDLMETAKVDYTRFFRALSCLDSDGTSALVDLFVARKLVNRNKVVMWVSQYLQRCEKEILSASERCEKNARGKPQVHTEKLLGATGH
ncbi:selenoprotein O and cysteine-containing homologs [Vibrio maritimus]|uniref:Selenoprotein O and cysteine-containing homologs n=1 Tax=Vibrio maritimus TaxID=990268 RepID=A0A090RWV1_9VIBR|nr:selenoprotein O and cysteine-containing homologs [Vibrio maritimus]